MGCGCHCGWGKQVLVLLAKNFLLLWRNRRATLVQLCAPAVLVLALLLIQVAIEARVSGEEGFDRKRNPAPKELLEIPRCIIGPDRDSCFTFAYVPAGDPIVEAIIDDIVDRTPFLRELPDRARNVTYGLQGFRGDTSLDLWLFEKRNLNKTQAAVIFDFYSYLTSSLPAAIEAAEDELMPMINSSNSTANNTTGQRPMSIEELPRCNASTPPELCTTVLSYTLQFNETSERERGQEVNRWRYLQIPLQYAIENALLRYQTNNSNAEFRVRRVDFPHRATQVIDVVGDGGPLFFFGALMFNLVVALIQIVAEKETPLREAMRLSGMYISAYWVSFMVLHAFMNTLTVLILIIVGAMCQFNFFLKNDFIVYLIHFECFAISIVGLSILISSVMFKASRAVTVGFIFFLCGALFTFVSFLIYNETSIIANILVSLFSPAAFARGVQLMGDASASDSADGIRAGDVCDGDKLPICGLWLMMLFDSFVYIAIGLYIDAIVPRPLGRRLHPCFCFLPSFWLGTQRKRSKLATMNADQHKQEEGQDDDVYHEELDVMNGKTENAAVTIYGLYRNFTDYNRCCTKRDVHKAVHPLYYHIDDGGVFCLLGPNGAGKSTTISMLTTLLPPSGGDAIMFGYSVQKDPVAIGKQLGLCPQFDVLWPELTAWEHLFLFCVLKNVPAPRIEVNKRLIEVGLKSAAKRPSGTYSGGMKRRLSVALAFCGNPKIVFLDEPTTGMDPISRRHVWDAIEKEKKERAIILTTHSMEEADFLGDTIAIMKKGKLHCLGTPVRLKNRYGTGMRITVNVPKNGVDSVTAFFRTKLPEVDVGPYNYGYITYSMPNEFRTRMAPFLAELEKVALSMGITDVQLESSSLEAVFLRIAGAGEEDEGVVGHLKAQEGEGPAEAEGSSSGKEKQTMNGSASVRPVNEDDEEF